MKKLTSLAFSKKIYKRILLFTLIFALGLTLATQLEMVTLGILTKKGPDFFTLFAKNPHDEKVPFSQMEERFTQIDQTHSGSISREDIASYMERQKPAGVIDNFMHKLNDVLPIEKDITAFILFIIFVAFLKAITLFSYRFGTRLFAIYMGRDIRQKYFEHIQTLPMSFYQSHNIGALSSRAVNDAYVIADAINSALINYFQTPFALISSIVLCLIVSWKLFSIVFFGLPLVVGSIIFLAKRIRHISKQLQKKQESFSSVLVEFLNGIQTIKLFVMEDFSLKKYKENNDAMAKLEVRNARYDVSARPILHTVGMLFLVGVILFGLYGLHLPLYEVFFFCGLLYVAYEPIKKFAEENARIQRGIAACDRLFEVLDLHPDIQDDQGAQSFIPFTSNIAFNDVTFSYSSHKNDLNNISFSIKKGEMIAIVGSTGSGKSTLIFLLTRLFDPQSGTISIDGIPIQNYTQKSLREFFSVVPQRPFLFIDTVKENIRFGRPYTDEEVYTAAKKAHAEEFIVQLPQGYETQLAEAGKSLSGGQQQRLAIARALIKKSPVLILDEATSSLDTVSEQQIKQILHELKGNVTQIVVAHRLSTIEGADRIIVMEKGQVVSVGTKEELLGNCPVFQKLYTHK